MSTEMTFNTAFESAEMQRIRIRNVLSNLTDLQKLRISTGNRLVASHKELAAMSHIREEEDDEAITKVDGTYKKRAGASKKPLTEEEKAAIREKAERAEKKENDSYLQGIMSDYKRITDTFSSESINKYTQKSIQGVIDELNKSKDTELKHIRSVMDYTLAVNYNQLLQSEEALTAQVKVEVEKHPMWDAFFKDVKGCGPLSAAACLCYFDITKARHASSFWKYAGLDVVVLEDGTCEGKSRKRTHMVKTKYVDRKTGEVSEKDSLGYNPLLKTKLLGVLGPCLLKASLRTQRDEDGKPVKRVASGYAQAYLDYMNRLNSNSKYDDYSAVHKHNMANRYMIKQFVRDMWWMWRLQSGLGVSMPYEVEKLGNKPHGWNDATDGTVVNLQTYGKHYHSYNPAMDNKDFTEKFNLMMA